MYFAVNSACYLYPVMCSSNFQTFTYDALSDRVMVFIKHTKLMPRPARAGDGVGRVKTPRAQAFVLKNLCKNFQ